MNKNPKNEEYLKCPRFGVSGHLRHLCCWGDIIIFDPPKINYYFLGDSFKFFLISFCTCEGVDIECARDEFDTLNDIIMVINYYNVSFE